MGNTKRPLFYGLTKPTYTIIQSNPNITVVKQTPESFKNGLELYKLRSDKQYSMPDCISMITMKERKITHALTNDHHFSQEGFDILF